MIADNFEISNKNKVFYANYKIAFFDCRYRQANFFKTPLGNKKGG
jgi:hypothetical protein